MLVTGNGCTTGRKSSYPKVWVIIAVTVTVVGGGGVGVVGGGGEGGGGGGVSVLSGVSVVVVASTYPKASES